MNTQLKYKIYSRFEEDWGKSSLQFSVCVKILEYLLSRPINQLKHLTYGSLKLAIGENRSDIHILQAIQYLCGDRASILSLHFEFIDENEQSFDLDDDEVKHAQKTGKLAHPKTGENIENFEDQVLMYFTPSSFIKEAQN